MRKDKKPKKRRLLRYRDVRRWSDFDRMREYTSFFPDAVRRLFIPQKSTFTETFEQATQRYQLDADNLSRQQKVFLGLALIMFCFAIALVLLSVRLVLEGSYPGAAAGVGIACLAAGMAFRYHFWYYQIKARKLGCSVKEWFQKGLLGRS